MKQKGLVCRNARRALGGMLMTMAVALTGCAGDKTGTENSGEQTQAVSSAAAATEETTLNDQIVIGIPQDLDNGFDPHKLTASGTKEVFYNIYEGLVKYDSTGALIPALAQDYVISEDGTTYTFTLRDGVKFHDGSDLTAEDVIYSIERCADPENPLVPTFTNISSCVKTADNEVTITLEQPDSNFMAYMTTAILPASNTDPDANCIGTGPYKYVTRSPQESVTLTRFDDYWGEKAKIKDVILKVVANPDAIVMEMKGGSVDMFWRVTSTQAAELEGTDFKILEGTMNLVQALYLNHQEKPFDDLRVRQALCYAIDPQEIMDFVSDGKGTEIGSSMFPAFKKYFDESLNHTYDQNIEKAKELLKEAGYADGFTFTITVPSNYPQHVSTAEVLVEQFKKIGVTAEIQLIDWDSWVSDVYSNRNYVTTVVGLDASTLTARALLERFTSTAAKNFTHYNNPKYDEVFADAIATTDDEQQTAFFKECLKILSEDAANVYIQDLPTFAAMKSNIQGYEFYPLYVQNLAALYFE